MEIIFDKTDDFSSLVAKDIKEMGPFLQYQQEFDLMRDQDHIQIAFAVQTIFQKLETMFVGLKDSFRLQLRNDADNWKLEVLLDPKVWYDWKRLPDGKLSKNDNDNAESFLKYVRDNFKQSPGSPSRLTDPEFRPCEHKLKSICDKITRYKCVFGHYEWECGARVSHKTNPNKVCEYYVLQERRKLCPDECTERNQCNFCLFEKNGFITVVRKERTRELELVPTLEYIQKGTAPHSNESTATWSVFWKTAKRYITLLKTLIPSAENPVERIVFNFGTWETEMDRDRNLLECHAHAHFWIFPQHVQHIPILFDHHQDLEDYMWINAQDLNFCIGSN